MVTYEDTLPLAWRFAELSAEQAEQLGFNNRYVLSALASLEEHSGSAGRLSEDQPALGEELMRIESMLHLVLKMLAHEFAAKGGLPAEHRMQIGVDEIQFVVPNNRQEPEPGRTGVLELHFHSSIPEPFRVYGRFRDPESRDGNDWQIFKPDPPLEGDVRNEFQRLVFRHHRRWVAATRKARTATEQTSPEESVG